MLPPLRRLLPVLLLLLLAQLNTCSAALASNPGDFNVVTCGADKGITVSLSLGPLTIPPAASEGCG